MFSEEINYCDHTNSGTTHPALYTSFANDPFSGRFSPSAHMRTNSAIFSGGSQSF